MNQLYFANSGGYLCSKKEQFSMMNQNYFANGFFEEYATLSNLINFKQIHWEFFYAKRNQK